jgi:hypothetical protein
MTGSISIFKFSAVHAIEHAASEKPNDTANRAAKCPTQPATNPFDKICHNRLIRCLSGKAPAGINRQIYFYFKDDWLMMKKNNGLALKAKYATLNELTF